MRRHRFGFGFSIFEAVVVVLLLGLLLAVAVPNFVRARRGSRLQDAVNNLKKIENAKQIFAVKNKLLIGSAVNDGSDLCPGFLNRWPVGPIPGATYAANALGMEPTVNGLTAAQLQSACTANGTGCPF